MMKFKNIRMYLDKKGIHYYESDNGQKLIIRACAFDSDEESNFYDYGKPYKKPMCYSKEKFFQELFNDPRIIIVDCSDCCACAGW